MLPLNKIPPPFYEGLDGWKTHVLKTWPPHYQALEAGTKTAELRFDDRDYKVGDHLNLQEFETETGAFTGAGHYQKITHIVRGPGFGLSEGHVMLSLSRLAF